jgi:hypothetical protein
MFLIGFQRLLFRIRRRAIVVPNAAQGRCGSSEALRRTDRKKAVSKPRTSLPMLSSTPAPPNIAPTNGARLRPDQGQIRALLSGFRDCASSDARALTPGVWDRPRARGEGGFRNAFACIVALGMNLNDRRPSVASTGGTLALEAAASPTSSRCRRDLALGPHGTKSSSASTTACSFCSRR